MNWGFIGWVLGIILTVYVLKFAVMALSSLFSKDSMENVMNITGKKISKMNKKLTKKIKDAAAKRKENQPIITIK